MPRDARFWRYATLIAGAHLAALVAFIQWGRLAPAASPERIVWMSGSAGSGAETSPSPVEAKTKALAPTPPPAPEMTPTAAAEKSEIQLPAPTPSQTPLVRPSPKIRATPTPVTKASPRTTPRPTPKKPATAKSISKPPPSVVKAKAAQSESEKPAGESTDKKESGTPGGNGTAIGGPRSSEFNWYGRMLHDRFHNEWEQPTSVVATGSKMAAVAKIRIERDGRVSNFTIIRPSGNVVVDESVAAVAKKVTRVDPLPPEFANEKFYEVTITFGLNP